MPFDPLTDALPDADALILAGGFPEVFGAELSANAPLRDGRSPPSTGPILAECGGLLYLARELDGHPMCGVLDATATMTGRLTLGYREVTADGRPPGLAGGHDRARPRVPLLRPSRPPATAWTRSGGHVRGLVHASYLHTHWAATPEVADRLVAACG